MKNEIPVRLISRDMKNWTAKVRVFEKLHAQVSVNSPRKTKYQKMIFIDDEGTKVIGALFDKAINLYDEKFVQFKSYYISNARITEIPKEYQIDGVKIQWGISASTIVEDAVDNMFDILSINLETTPFSLFGSYVNRDEYINVLGVVVNVQPIKCSYSSEKDAIWREIIISDEQMNYTTMTLWGKFAEVEGSRLEELQGKFPAIYCRRIAVRMFKGLHLQTRFISSVSIDPPFVEVYQLKLWAIKNQSKLKQRMFIGAYLQIDPVQLFQTNPKITLIAEIMPTDHIVWVRGSIIIDNLNQNFFYTSCSNCGASIKAPIGTKFTCITCRQQAEVQPKCVLEITIVDDSGMLSATTFGEQGENILLLTARQIQELTDQKIPLPLELALFKLKDATYIVQVRCSKIQSGFSRARHNVLHLFNANKVNESPLLLTQGVETESSASVVVVETSTTKSVRKSLASALDKEYENNMETETSSSFATPSKKIKNG